MLFVLGLSSSKSVSILAQLCQGFVRADLRKISSMPGTQALQPVDEGFTNKKAFERLPKTIVPVHYKLRIQPYLKDATFAGEVVIDVRVSDGKVALKRKFGLEKFIQFSHLSASKYCFHQLWFCW